MNPEACSGLFDLKAVRLSARSAYVKFTDEIEQALSSQRHLNNLNAPVIVAYGTLETPEFQRQPGTSPPQSTPRASQSNSSSASVTTTLRLSKRSPILMGFWAGQCWSR